MCTLLKCGGVFARARKVSNPQPRNWAIFLYFVYAWLCIITWHYSLKPFALLIARRGRARARACMRWGAVHIKSLKNGKHFLVKVHQFVGKLSLDATRMYRETLIIYILFDCHVAIWFAAIISREVIEYKCFILLRNTNDARLSWENPQSMSSRVHQFKSRAS